MSQNVKDIQYIKQVEKVITKRWQGRYQPYQNYQPRGRGQGAYGGYSGGYQPRGQSFQQRGKFFPRGRGYPRSRNWPRGQATFHKVLSEKGEVGVTQVIHNICAEKSQFQACDILDKLENWSKVTSDIQTLSEMVTKLNLRKYLISLMRHINLREKF